VILSHTPMRALAAKYADRPVLISGRHDVLNVARAYGFSKALSTEQLGAAYPASTPFISYLGGQQQQGEQQQGQQQCPVWDRGWGTEEEPIAAVLVMHDPSDWARDLQLLSDVLLTRGVPARLAAAPEGAPPVALYFSNADLLWVNEFPRCGGRCRHSGSAGPDPPGLRPSLEAGVGPRQHMVQARPSAWPQRLAPAPRLSSPAASPGGPFTCCRPPPPIPLAAGHGSARARSPPPSTRCTSA
jgi:hypothetical protein